MHTRKKVLTLLAVLALTACQEREDEDPGFEDSQAPRVTATESLSIQEGDTASIPFNAIDDGSDYEDLRISISSSSIQGNADINKAGKTLTYTAPWLSKEKTLNENVTIKVIDEAGNSAEHTYQITVEDIDSPVSVELLDPNIGFGFEESRSEKEMFLWVEESRGNLNVRMSVDEVDGDEIMVDYSVESDVLNDGAITPSFNSEQTELNMEFDVPSLSGVVYENIAATFTTEDNDAASEVNVGITVFNTPTIKMLPAGDITESEGGVIPFEFSESSSYPGDYMVRITDPEGEDLSFNVDYQIDRERQEVVIGTSDPFQGDQRVLVEITLRNQIPNLNGDVYEHTTKATRAVTILEDRDDDFSSAIESFDDLKIWFSDMEERKDEYAITQLMTRHFLLEGDVSYSETQAVNAEVLRLLEEDYTSLNTSISNIEESIADGESNQVIQSLIDDFVKDLTRAGLESRKYALDWYNNTTSGMDEENIPLESMNAKASISVLGDYDAVTHFVGNNDYGRFRDGGDGPWQFNESTAYFSVADVSGPGCI
jgi:hypothetical protein